MSNRVLGAACAALFIAGCSGSNSSLPTAGSALMQGPGSSQMRLGHKGGYSAPAPMPSPHLLTSIDTTDLLNITPAQAQPYLTMGHTNSGPAQADLFSSAGIEAVPYGDIDHFLPGDQSGTNSTLSMADVALTCDGQPVEWVKPSHPIIYLTDPRNPGTLAAWEQWYTNFVAAGGQTWAIYEDTANNPYTFAVPSPPCAADGSGPVTTQEWTAAEEAQEGAMQTFSGKPVVFNGLAPGYHTWMPYANPLLDGPAAGGEAEACAPSNTTEWLNQVTIEIHAVQKKKFFICHGNDLTDGSTPQAIAFRNYHFATMMLEYDPAYTVYESAFAVGASNLRVEPESDVVMLNPYKQTINLATDLLKPGGAYARRYKDCYLNGTDLGQCAAVVNPTKVPVPFPFAWVHYQHTMLLTGSGIYDGATVSNLGPAPVATVGPYSGEVAFL